MYRDYNTQIGFSSILQCTGTITHRLAFLLSYINIYKASSVANLSSRILKDAFSVLIPNLTYMINLSLTTGIFPPKWKIAKIVPLQKSGDHSDVNNLRPISLLPLPGKLIERAVHTKLSEYLEQNKLLNEFQGGFRTGHSTIGTVADLTDDILLNINDNKCTLVTFIDFRKAFDTVNHAILLRKLELLRIHPHVLKWLEDYLRGRKQCTIANNCTSEEEAVVCGVPQGSILGPLLFLIYVNDIHNKAKECRLRLYADDTATYASLANPRDALCHVQAELDRLHGWCQRNKLTINTCKTKTMLFGTKSMIQNNNLNHLQIGGENIGYVTSYPYLGIKLDNKLTFELHIKETLKLVSHKLFLLSKIRKYLTKKQALIIFKSKILPYFDYGDIFCIGSHEKSLDKLQQMQNRALRICLKAPLLTSVKSLHLVANVPLLVNRRQAHLLNFMYKRKSNTNYLANKGRNTRLFEGTVLNSILARNKTAKRSTYIKGAIAWNMLPARVRSIPTYEAFKNHQKEWLKGTINEQ